jgi:hypothetical protein
MSGIVKVKITPGIAPFLSTDAGIDEKLKGLEESTGMEPEDQVLLIICLMKDADSTVKRVAETLFEALRPETLAQFLRSARELHPAILDMITRIHHSDADVVNELLGNNALSPSARHFLQNLTADIGASRELTVEETPAAGRDFCQPAARLDDIQDAEELSEEETAEDEEDETEPVDENREEFQSKYKLALSMGIADKIKTALTGDKEWRTLLIKDANKLVSGSVIKNPRITEAEILSLAKTGVQNDEIMRLICANKEWVKNIKIRKALVANPRTPLPNALRYLSTLGEKDLAGYAKSKNVSSVISTQARRMLQSKKK